MGDIFKLLDFLLKYGYITIPVILWMLWGWYHWRIFHTQHSDQYDDACNRRLSWLEQDRWSSLYINWLSVLLDKVSSVIGDAGQGKHNRISQFFGKFFGFDHNPWTEPSFNLLFRIALVYPILSFIVFWLMGGTGTVGDIELLPNDVKLSEAQRWGIGIAMFAGLFGLYMLILRLRSLSGWKAVLALSAVVYMWMLLATQSEFDKEIYYLLGIIVILMIVLYGSVHCYAISWLFNRDWRIALHQLRAAMWDIFVAIAFAMAIASASHSAAAVFFAVAVTFAVTFAVAFAFTVAFAFAFAVAVAFAGTGTVAIAVSIAVSIAVAILYRNIQTKRWAGLFWLLYLVLLLCLAFVAIRHARSQSSVLVLFWLAFPLLNVPLDWLSLGITRGLLQSICSGTHQGLRGFYWALADVVIAFIFLVLMATILFIAVQFANDLRFSESEETILDLGNLLHGMEKDPANPDYYWIYFMLFSTLLPTLVHFALCTLHFALCTCRRFRRALVPRSNSSCLSQKLAQRCR